MDTLEGEGEEHLIKSTDSRSSSVRVVEVPDGLKEQA
jgi:hypothetical protein